MKVCWGFFVKCPENGFILLPVGIIQSCVRTSHFRKMKQSRKGNLKDYGSFRIRCCVHTMELHHCALSKDPALYLSGGFLKPLTECSGKQLSITFHVPGLCANFAVLHMSNLLNYNLSIDIFEDESGA